MVGLALDEHISRCDNLTIHPGNPLLAGKSGSCYCGKAGVRLTIPAGVLIVCTGIQPLSEEADRFYGITCHTWKIGDVKRPGNIKAATLEGWIAGSQD